jgi:hypothetical protein
MPIMDLHADGISRDTANRWARLAAVVVGLIALVVVVWPGVAHLDLGDPYRARQQVSEKITTAANGTKTTERTTSPAASGLLEQSLGSGGLLLLRLGIVAIAAFLAAAVTQRILLGQFAFKAAGFELSALGEVTEAADMAIELLQTQARTVAHELAEMAAHVDAQQDQIAEMTALLGRVTNALPPDPRGGRA